MIAESSGALLTAEELLFRAALLAGLGRDAGPVAAEVSNGRLGSFDPSSGARTCVDAGSPLMCSLLAPGGRSLRILRRAPGETAADHQRWLRLHYQAGAVAEHWQVEAFSGEPAVAWQRALRLAGRLGCQEVLLRHHAALGPHGRIFNISWRLGEEVPGGWVSWQLDARYPAAEALAACGAGAMWPLAARLFQQLFGRPIASRSRPWSVACALQGDGPRLRLGTTIWARLPEDEAKRRRLAAVVETWGGDGRFAEGLYRLLASLPAPRRASRIGRAVEVELQGGQVQAVEFYLHVPLIR